VSVVDQLASNARITWFDTAGVVAGVALAVIYAMTEDSPRSIYLLYAGLVVVAAHAFVSIELLPRRRRYAREAADVAMAYREVLVALPSGIESTNGQHPPYRREPAFARPA